MGFYPLEIFARPKCWHFDQDQVSPASIGDVFKQSLRGLVTYEMPQSQLRRQLRRPSADGSTGEAFSKLRAEMVEQAIRARGIRSELVLDAMSSVPREAFLPHTLREFAYVDSPLPIEEGQTISQPYIVAFMTEALALAGGEKVLEIGTGSGYRRLLGQLADAFDRVHVRHENAGGSSRYLPVWPLSRFINPCDNVYR